MELVAGWAELLPSKMSKRPWWLTCTTLRRKSLIWRGIAQNTLNNNGNKNQQMVEKAVQKMFKQWPKS